MRKKIIFLIFILVISKFLFSQLPDIVAMEYYFDTDPGFGNGTSISVTPDSLINEDFTVDLTALSIGNHRFFVRTKDENGKWSLTYKQDIYKTNVTNTPSEPLPDIVAAEYFFDIDPGFGNGIPITVSPDSLIDENFTAEISSLNTGTHLFNVRVLDEYGKWSLNYRDSIDITLTADFTVSDTIVSAGQEIQFTDTSFGNPISWEWDFDNDGITDSEEQNPQWTYYLPGTYTVTLNIDDGTNTNQIIKTDLILVQDVVISNAIEHCVDDETVALWHMNGIAGSTDKKDNAEETSALDLTEHNSPTAVPGFDGIAFGAYDLEADNNQYLSVADNDALDITGDFTLEAWIKPEHTLVDGERHTFISKYGSTQRSYFFEYYSDGSNYRLRMFLTDDGTTIHQAYKNVTALSANTWYYIVVTFDASVSDVSFFIDAVDQGINTYSNIDDTSIYNSSADFLIGANIYDTPQNFVDGVIDEVSMSSRAKSPEEIAKYYNGRVSAKYYSGSGDGYIYKNDSTDWDTVHNAVVGSGAVDNSSSTTLCESGKSSNGNLIISRGFLPFNTSYLSDYCNIKHASLGIYVNSKSNGDNDGNDWITLVQTSQDNENSLISEDYDTCGDLIDNPTEGIDLDDRADISDITLSEYKEFTLNSVGKNWISKTDYTKFGFREGHDILDEIYNGSPNTWNVVGISQSEYSGTQYDPYLWIEYTNSTEAVAAFTSDITSGYAPLSVQFIDTSTPQDSLISWSWDFGDGGTSSLQNPIYIYQNAGTYTVSVNVTDANSNISIETKMDYITVDEVLFDYCLDLECSNSQYAFIADENQVGLDIIGDLTYECWVNLESQPNIADEYCIVAKSDTGNQESWRITYNNDLSEAKHILLTLSSDGSVSHTTGWNYTFSTNEWQHIAITYNASAGSTELLVNGISKGLNSISNTSIFNSTGDFSIGAFCATAYLKFFDGKIAHAKIWDDIRTQQEIQQFMYQEPDPANEPNLQGYWKFNNSIDDETGNHNDLTLVNDPSFSSDAPNVGIPTAIEHCVDDETIALWHMNGAIGSAEKMDNAEGTTVLDLTEINSPTSTTGFDGTANGAYDLEASSSQYLSTTDFDEMNITSNLTLEAWIKPESISYSFIFFRGNTITTDYAFGTTSDGYLYGLYEGGSGLVTTIDSSFQMNIGSWYYVVFVHDDDNDEDRLFVNGILTKKETGITYNPQNETNRVINIGRYITGSSYFNGVVDEIKISIRAKSAEEIAKYYNGRVSAKYYSGSGDGVVRERGNASWNTTHDAANGDNVHTEDSVYIMSAYDDNANVLSAIYRGFFPFNTSSLPDTINIDSATLSLYVVSKEDDDNDGDDFINIVQTTSASETELVLADYNQCGDVDDPDEGATRIDIGDISTAIYNNWTLNSTSIGWISKTGYTKLGAREGHDILDNPIAQVADSYNNILVSASSETGTTQDPYLWIEYEKSDSIFADFTTDITDGLKPLSVQFTDLSTSNSGFITTWNWDFNNDGSIDSNEQNPTWIYEDSGVYTVKLTVSDGSNSATEIKTDYITVYEEIYSQDFDLSGSLPNNWSVTDGGAIGETWFSIQDSGEDWSSQINGVFTGSCDDWLISPLINCQYFTNIGFQFSNDYQDPANPDNSSFGGFVKYSLNGGSTWQDIHQYWNQNVTGTDSYAISVANEQDSLQIAFQYIKPMFNASDYWNIDDLIIYGTVTDSLAPTVITDLIAENQPSSCITLYWTPPTESHFDYYEVYYDTIAVGLNSNLWSFIDDPALSEITSDSTMITGLESYKTYNFRIRSFDTYGFYSELSNTATNTVLPPETITDFTALSDTPTSVTLQWATPQIINFSHYEVFYDTTSVDTTSNLWSTLEDPNLADCGTNTTEVVGLEQYKIYNFRIRALTTFGFASELSDTASDTTNAEYNPPIISDSVPSQPSSWLNSLTVTIGCIISDAESGVDPNTIQYRFDYNGNGIYDTTSEEDWQDYTEQYSDQIFWKDNETKNISLSSQFEDKFSKRDVNNIPKIQKSNKKNIDDLIIPESINYIKGRLRNDIITNRERYSQEKISEITDGNQFVCLTEVVFSNSINEGDSLHFEWRATDNLENGHSYSGTNNEQGIIDDWWVKMDITLPTGGLSVFGYSPDSTSVMIGWDPISTDDFFETYQIFYWNYDTVDTTAYLWDSSNDPALANQTTQFTTITGLTPNTNNYFLVRGIDEAGNGGDFNDVFYCATLGNGGIPSIPQNLSAISFPDYIELSWDLGPEIDLDYYRVFRDTIPEPTTAIDIVDVSGTRDNIPQISFIDPNSVSGKINYYRITVVDDDGDESGYSNEAITGAEFIVSDTTGYAPLQVQFTDLSLGNPISWQWDFNNDSIIDSYDQNPIWTYNETEAYTVSLTVSYGVISASGTKKDYVDLHVNIPDANFKAAVNSKLGQPAEYNPTVTEMNGISGSISASGSNIFSIEGAQYLTSLTQLWLGNNQISDISAVSGLTNLTELILSENQISDISAVSGLENLVWLWLWDNQISDISAVSELTNLTWLELYDNQISDISAVSFLTSLTDLYLNNNLIIDIPSISGLTNLTDLRLQSNQISDILAVSGLTNLSILYLSDNQISDISAVSGLTNLTNLRLNDNQTSDISAVSDLTNLTNLSLYQNQINDISTVSGLTNLTNLLLSQNQISDISAISNLINLETLWLMSNQFSDISAVSGLTNLRNLGLGDNQISDISAVSGLTNLTNLSLHQNQINDISAVSGLTNLPELVLSSNQISDISAVSGLTNLTDLVLNSNQINDISAVSDLTNLTYLDLENNQISDIYAIIENTSLGSGDRLFLYSNQFSIEALNAHIPILESRGFHYLTYPSTYNNYAACYPNPARNETGVSANTNLEWRGNFPCRDAVYDVWLGETNDNLLNVGSGTAINDTLYSFTPALSVYTDYWWRVRAVTATDTVWSGLWHFITGGDLLLSANFEANTTSGFTPLMVEFSDLSFPVDSIAIWFWDFGDGADSTYTSYLDTITHIYQYPDTFSVSLTITDLNDSIYTEIKENYITVFPTAPTAEFIVDTTYGYSPFEVHFEDLSIQGSEAIAEWYWDFGDGTDSTYTAIIDTITHIYEGPGLFTVSLTVTDINDSTDTEIKADYITVVQPVLSVTPESLDFETELTELELYIENIGTGNLSWNIIENISWLSASPLTNSERRGKGRDQDQGLFDSLRKSSRSVIDTVLITIDRIGLDPGIYSDSLLVASNGGTDTIYVSMELLDTFAPSEPTGLVAYAGVNQVTLEWDLNPETDLNKYRIFRDTTSPAITLIDSLIGSPPDTTYVDTGLINYQIYYYRLTAVDTVNNESNYSIEVNATPYYEYQGPVWYISTTGDDTNGDGSEGNPYATIQFGINASTNGDTILVEAGTYQENINFNGKNIVVSSYQLVNADSTEIANTIIQGSSGSVVTIINGEVSTTMLNGFTIIGGLGNSYISGSTTKYFGGGIDCQNSNPVLQNLVIKSNEADYGAGLYLHNADVLIKRVQLTGNKADEKGGGIFIDQSSPEFINCTISGNMGLYGGGLLIKDSDQVELTNCIIWSNDLYQIAFDMDISPSHLYLYYTVLMDGESGIEFAYNYGTLETDPNDILTFSPLFAAPLYSSRFDNPTTAGNFHLYPFSQCIDAGNPNPVYNDPDGTRNDIGAWYYDQNYPVSCFQNVFFVGANGSNASGTGSYDDPFATINYALSLIQTSNIDSIIVFYGTYFENVQISTPVILGSLYLLDPYTTHIDSTIIDGSNPSNPSEGSTLAVLGGVSRLQIESQVWGFCIKNGSGWEIEEVIEYPNGQSQTISRFVGGGIFVHNCSPLLSFNLIFENGNSNTYEGGGIYTFIDDDDRSRGTRNSRTILNYTNNFFYNNYAEIGKSISSDGFAGTIDLSNCEFDVYASFGREDGAVSNFWCSGDSLVSYDFSNITGREEAIVTDISIDPDSLGVTLSKVYADESNPVTINMSTGISRTGRDLLSTFPLQMVNWVSLVGSGEENTIIDAGDTNRVLVFDNVEGVNIELLKITGGNCDIGGGAYIKDSNIDFSNVKIENNISDIGGGIFSKNSTTSFTSVDISGNTAELGMAGGIYFKNSSSNLSNLTLANNTVIPIGDPQDGYGGGIFVYNTDIVIENITISGNVLAGQNTRGGGIYIRNDVGLSTSTIIRNVELTGNSANQGGGIALINADPLIERVLISDNTAFDRGGGIYCYNSHPVLRNVTVVNNNASIGTGGIYMHGNGSANPGIEIMNSILWNNGIYQLTLDGLPKVATVTYTDVDSVYYRPSDIVTLQPGNINADPLFVNAAEGDYHLAAGSPCISAGNPEPIYNDPDGTRNDMGVYYFVPDFLNVPDNVQIVITTDSIYISWDPTDNATSYKVYSSDDPLSEFTEDMSGVFNGDQWQAPLLEGKKFYYVKAVYDDR